MTEITNSNGFWLFLGIIVGSVVQFLFHLLVLRLQKQNVKKVFRAEMEINRSELNNLQKEIEKMKHLISSGQKSPIDLFFHFGDFNYSSVQTLIGTGHFHGLLGAKGVKSYFKFMNDLNSSREEVQRAMLIKKHEDRESIQYLDWLLDAKIKEWNETLDQIDRKLK